MARTRTVAADGLTAQQRSMIKALPDHTIAIDPGETCGVARTYEVPTPSGLDLKLYYGSLSRPLEEFLQGFNHMCLTERIDLVIVESYRIYPDKAMMHIGQPLVTAELIGAIKWIAGYQGIRVIEQPAGIKATTGALLKGRGFKAVGKDQHAKDAEVHLWYHALREIESQLVTTGRSRK